MSRIANYASQQILNSYLQTVQQRINKTQIQITSEQKSQDYIGIGADTQRLISLEVSVSTLTTFQRNNNIEDINLKSTETALTAVQSTIKDFRNVLTSFNTLSVKDENSIRTIQEQAFRSMQTLQSYLNTEVGGRFLFSGNRVNTSPVNMGLSTLGNFQTKYDGLNLSYPTTRAMHMQDFSINKDGTNLPNWLTFTQDADGNAATAGVSTITATTAQFSNVTVGSSIQITGTANNNGTYEVSKITGGGTTIEINTKMLTNETNAATLTGTNGTIVNASVTFDRAAGTIVGATGSLSTLVAGSSFTVSGTAQNNGTYIIESNTGSTLKIKQSKLIDEGTTAQTVSTATAQSFTFTNGTSTIAAGAGTPFSAAQPGMKVTIGGTTSNNATFTVASVLGGGSSITVKEAVTTETPVGGNDTATITVATPTLDLVAQSFTFTQNVGSFDTIDSGVTSSFSALTPGMKITFGNTVNNNATFTVASVSSTGQSITVRQAVTAETPAGTNDTALVTQADGTVQALSYYKGDNFTRVHRAAKNREFTINLDAADTAFEKAIRAMGLIAQGKFGTVGGLEQSTNAHRLNDAVNLLDLSLKPNATSNPQYKAGYTNNIEQTFITVGYQRTLLKNANTSHTRLAGFFEQRVSELENVNKLDVITRLLDDQRSLEASYRAMATIRGLSLQNFLR